MPNYSQSTAGVRTGEHRAGRHVSARRWPSAREWCWFALQLLLVCSVQIGEDSVRGNVFPVGRTEAERNAHRIVHLEQLLHLFVEPAWQSAVLHLHALHGALSGALLVRDANLVYGVLHLAVPGVLAAWVYVARRARFGELRNTFLWTSILALGGYEFFPAAPPRLTSHLMVGGRPYHFVDTMQGVIGDGRMHGVPLAYNAYSAMPSMHIAWALVVSLMLLRLQRSRILSAAALLYPLLMLAVVVLTGSHWLLDAVGAALDVTAACAIALLWERYKGRRRVVARVGEEAGSRAA